ncbi:hypothetical protein LCGC14_0923640 [marine sediment metagenome]|uniref:Uncharacterized protein n=1 Tax=marine sediment metagenome TaxID=412755 RepID=A0A0F9PAR9_9ZZZZ
MTDKEWAQWGKNWKAWKEKMLKPGAEMEKPARKTVELSDRWAEQNELYIAAMDNGNKKAAMEASNKMYKLLDKINRE